MQIEKLGDQVAEYTVTGSVVQIGDIEIDCAALQVDTAITVDICRNAAGNLVQGVSEGVSYVASLVIPPKETSARLKTENGEPVLGDGKEIDEIVEHPINMNKVRLILWPYEQNKEVRDVDIQ